MTTISVCVSTHERARLLPRVLEGLAAQERLADDIVIVDSSSSNASEAIVRAFAAEHSLLPVRYVRSARSALPWNRWLGLTHARGDVVLFLDDDVRLAPPSLRVLESAYDTLSRTHDRPVAGVGFLLTWDDGAQVVRDPRELRERWQGTARRAAGSMSPGGIPVSPAGLSSDEPLPVKHFWGGGMSYRREVLERVGYLDRLVALYEAGIGRAEDIVLSSQAGRHGELFLITQPLALHPRGGISESTPYAKDGWRMGITNTWGKAHTLRWTATDTRAHTRDVCRVLSLEFARSVGQVARHPLRWAGWRRLAGAACGIARTALWWRRIPTTPYSERVGGAVPTDAYEGDQVVRRSIAPVGRE